MSSTLLARIAELQDQNEQLSAELAHLRAVLDVDFRDWVPGVHMTRREQAMFSLLMKREIVSHEAFMTCISGDDWGQQSNIVHVYISKLRQKLRPHNVTIETIWGVGFRLSPDVKRAIEAGLAS